jgi:hypothetical protein
MITHTVELAGITGYLIDVDAHVAAVISCVKSFPQVEAVFCVE